MGEFFYIFLKLLMNLPSRALSAIRPEFRDQARSKMVGVSIDSSKSFHKVLIFDFHLDLIEGPFEIDVLRSGFEQLLDSIERAKRLREAQQVVIGIEGAGSYSLHLSRELAQVFAHVYILNPLTVAIARKQKLLHGQKTDAIDVAVMADLLLHGHGSLVSKPQPIFSTLRDLTVWRHRQAHFKGKIKQLIISRLDRTLPGLSVGSRDTPALVKDVTTNSILRGIIEVGLTPQEVLRLPESALRKRLQPYLKSGCRPSPLKLQAYLRGMLLPSESDARVNLQLVKQDLALLRYMGDQIDLVEQRMIALVRRTPGRWLLGQLKGLSDIQVASYIGALGDPRKFKSAKQVYAMAGFCPRQHESGGTRTKKRGIVATGRRLLRTILFQMANTVSKHEPLLLAYSRRLRHEKHKGYVTAQIATANKLNRILIALMRDQRPYRRGEDRYDGRAPKPDHLTG